jgi:hypothetical protein
MGVTPRQRDIVGNVAEGILRDPIIQQAVSRVAVRAERQEDIAQLVATFVDPGISVQLENDNNQILYGRRGTGKTHVLKVVDQRAADVANTVSLYVDMRTLGSNSVFSDEGRPMHVRATSLLKDILAAVENALLEYVTDPANDLPGHALEKLDALTTAITRTSLADVTTSVESGAATEDREGGEAGISLSVKPSISFGSRSESVASESEKVTRQGKELNPIYFQELTASFREVLEAAGVRRVVILLDEWTAIPFDLQPHLAEFLKRTFFTIPQVTVKIASLEYRSNFSEPLGHNNVLGFELSADISSVIELDDYFVYDRNAEQTIMLFAELLFRHIYAEVDAQDATSAASVDGQLEIVPSRPYMTDAHGIATADALIRRLFASPDAFKELVRAGEGVARDFINIFSSAFFSSVRRSRPSIDMKAVQEAARDWYEKDKAPNVDEEQERFLRTIIESVIAERRARSFLLEKQYEKDRLILSLFDFRLLHLVQRGYADKDNPGVRYNIYTLDYGTYVDLIGTQRAPEDDFTEDIHDEDTVVPFDDRRSIRRIILRPEHLTNGG